MTKNGQSNYYFLFLKQNNRIMNVSVGKKLKDFRKSRGFTLEEIWDIYKIEPKSYCFQKRNISC